MIVLDLETTGLDCKKDKIIEFAAIKIDENFNEIDRLNFFINPEIKVSNEVIKLTWIPQETLDKSLVFKDRINEIKEFLEWDRTIIWHNIQFDIWFLQEYWFLKKNNFLDTFVLSSIFLEKQDSYALEVLSDKLKIEHEFKHRAIWDVLANRKLFEIIVWEIKKLNPETSNKFFELIEQNWIKWKYFNFLEDIKSWLIWNSIKIENKNKIENKIENKNKNSINKTDSNLSQNSNQEIFEFQTKTDLFQKIEQFFNQEEESFVIIPSFLRNLIFEKYQNFPEINLIYWKKFHWSEKKFFNLILDKKNFSHLKNLEIREFFELKIFLTLAKNLELNLKNIHISYDEYEIWTKIIDDEKWIKIWKKNLIEFKDFAELKNNNSLTYLNLSKKKLFIEPEINFEDKFNFASLNYIIWNLWEEEKNILNEKLENLKKYFLPENFNNFSNEEKEISIEKRFWKYWLTIQINSEKIKKWDWEYFKNFEDKNNDKNINENIAFSTEWRKKTEEIWKKFFEEIKDFSETFKNFLEWKENFSWMKKNLENFLDNSENNKNNFYKFIKISENNISFSAQKIDLISEFKDDFKDASFWFLWWWLKILENSKSCEEKNFNFVKKIFWLNNFQFLNQEFKNKKINYSYPKDPNAVSPKHRDFENFMLNQISEICLDNKKNIWILVNNKKDLESIYKNLIENYPNYKIFWEWMSWWKNKILHNINESENFILIAQKWFYELFFANSEKHPDKKIDLLIFTKFPFDPPNWIFKLRQEFYKWKFWDYVLPRSLLKTKQIITLSLTENVFYCDKRVWNEDWAKHYCNL